MVVWKAKHSPEAQLSAVRHPFRYRSGMGLASRSSHLRSRWPLPSLKEGRSRIIGRGGSGVAADRLGKQRNSGDEAGHTAGLRMIQRNVASPFPGDFLREAC